jgi:DNA-binding transcriptional LysR family regulator
MRTQINLEGLQVVDAIVREGSFAAAAESLHRVPSSVTYAVRRLEEALGVTLFDRGGHRAELTPAGEALLREGRDLLQMADALGRNVQRVATGWEAELRVAVGDLIPFDPVLDLCEAFYAVAPETRLRLSHEVLGGAWDALYDGRADLVIGASGDPPMQGGYSIHPMGEVQFVFVVAPEHPLAHVPEPLPMDLIRQYRAVAAADSSRGLPPRTVGLLPGQPVLTVPDLQTKRDAHMRGLGVGYLPLHMVETDIEAGRLVMRETEDGLGNRPQLFLAWPSRHLGKGLEWFRTRLLVEPGIDWFGRR